MPPPHLWGRVSKTGRVELHMVGELITWESPRAQISGYSGKVWEAAWVLVVYGPTSALQFIDFMLPCSGHYCFK